jgi:hypothetical protein
VNSGLCCVEIPSFAEVAIDLVHALETADDKALQVQLGRDAQKELHIERVVMGEERPRQRTARDRLHHRRLDFEVTAAVQKAADRCERRGCAPRKCAASPG